MHILYKAFENKCIDLEALYTSRLTGLLTFDDNFKRDDNFDNEFFFVPDSRIEQIESTWGMPVLDYVSHHFEDRNAQYFEEIGKFDTLEVKAVAIGRVRDTNPGTIYYASYTPTQYSSDVVLGVAMVYSRNLNEECCNRLSISLSESSILAGIDVKRIGYVMRSCATCHAFCDFRLVTAKINNTKKGKNGK